MLQTTGQMLFGTDQMYNRFLTKVPSTRQSTFGQQNGWLIGLVDKSTDLGITLDRTLTFKNYLSNI